MLQPYWCATRYIPAPSWNSQPASIGILLRQQTAVCCHNSTCVADHQHTLQAGTHAGLQAAEQAEHA